MRIVIACVLAVLLGIVVFMSLRYSPVAARYDGMVKAQMAAVSEAEAAAGAGPEWFTEADIAGLPQPVQRYFRHCGYLGTPKMSYMQAFFTNVDFVMSPDRTIKIDYQQLNLVERPDRLALISSSIFGIPFEGLDSYQGGKGGMQGILAKLIPLFDQRGEIMDRSCLVTWLAECLMVPNAALQDFVHWSEQDETHAAARITWEGISAEGVFAFSQEGELLSFRTSDRVAVDMEGKETKADWSAYFRDYHSVGGLRQPGVLQSVWHYEQGDCVYFNENERAVEIRYQ